MSSLIVYETKDKIIDYREMPESFDGYWKIGDTIKSTNGLEDCVITEIVLNTTVNRERVNSEKKRQNQRIRALSKSKEHLIKKPKLKETISSLYEEISKDKYSEFLKSEGLRIEDFMFKNILKCFTRLIINDQKINCKIIKKNDTNVMTYDFLSKYLDSDILSVDLRFSIIDKDYTFEISDEKILLYKRDEVFTLKILHVDCKDILSRLPKYMKETRKQTT